MEREELRPLLRRKFPPHRTYLLPALHFLQEELGHLPEWALQVVAWHLRTPASVVYGAATSYTELRIHAPAQHLVRVCSGLSCWHGGGQELLADLSRALGVAADKATEDGRVTLEETPCAYRCPLAPLAEVDGVWLGRADAGQVVSLLEE
ncbi:MAG: NAD(P)H-dependent oxidoreductase subunit E [Chloroflexota bacterium]|nr:NAD(P)H-dependent oxidoreductase subunit E [Chloroflexota bacterium]